MDSMAKRLIIGLMVANGQTKAVITDEHWEEAGQFVIGKIQKIGAGELTEIEIRPRQDAADD